MSGAGAVNTVRNQEPVCLYVKKGNSKRYVLMPQRGGERRSYESMRGIYRALRVCYAPKGPNEDTQNEQLQHAFETLDLSLTRDSYLNPKGKKFVQLSKEVVSLLLVVQPLLVAKFGLKDEE